MVFGMKAKSLEEIPAVNDYPDIFPKELPHLFRGQPNLEDEIHFKWGRFVTTRKIHQIKHTLFFSKLFFIVELENLLKPEP